MSNKEGNVLFNDVLNTFYLRLLGVRHVVKDHSWGNLLPLLPIRFCYMHHPTGRIAHTTAFVTPVTEHWLEWEITQWVHHEGSIRQPIAPWAYTVPQSYILFKCSTKPACTLNKKDISTLWLDWIYHMQNVCVWHIPSQCMSVLW